MREDYSADGDAREHFLLESIFLSLGGGLLGVAAGVGLANAASAVSSSLPTQVTAAIGIVFGVLPAYRSARLQPVEALRRE